MSYQFLISKVKVVLILLVSFTLIFFSTSSFSCHFRVYITNHTNRVWKVNLHDFKNVENWRPNPGILTAGETTVFDFDWFSKWWHAGKYWVIFTISDTNNKEHLSLKAEGAVGEAHDTICKAVDFFVFNPTTDPYYKLGYDPNYTTDVAKFYLKIADTPL